ncbi:MAG: LamG-like jellyroll fold domain-containing protein, partial [Limisphaerales bacterium]
GAAAIGEVFFSPVFDSNGHIVAVDANTVVSNGTTLVGALDEIEIYGRALTAYEIYSVTHPGVGLAFIDQPLNQRTVVGRPVIMHALAVGQDPMMYQWRFNGYDIPGAISNNFVLDAPQTLDSGTYSVLVSNPTGDITSADATLVVTNLTTPSMGLISRWSAEGSGIDSMGAHDGYTQNISYTKGVLGTAFQFNGTSAVRCGNIFGTMGTNDFTLDFWMKTISKQGVDIIGQRPNCSWTDCWDIRFISHDDGLTSVRCELGDHYDLLNPEYNAEQPSTAHSGLHLNDGVFHHIAAVHHANCLSLYVDGKFIEAGYSETPCDLENWGSFDMGVNVCDGNDQYNPFVGALDEIEVYNRALSDEEVYNTYSPNPALTLVRQPVSARVIEGQKATMFVSAAGQQPITYQWLLNGFPIAGATDQTYSLANAQLTDAGTYSVAVSNPLSSLTSVGGMLTVIPASNVLPGLAHYWPAEGSAEDIVSHVKAQGAGDVGYAAGVNGLAFSFNGNDQSTGGNSPTGDFRTNDFTIHLWVNNQNDGTIMSKLGAFGMYCYGGVITFNVADDSGHSCSINSSPTSIGYNAFHQVDVVRQYSTNMLMYIDSVLVASNTCPSLYNVYTIWAFGLCDEYGRNKRFGGLIDELQMYYRALSSDEVAWLYHQNASTPQVAAVNIRDLTQVSGSTFTLTAPAVTSSLPVTYQWMLNGVPIAGATGSSYTVSNFDPSGAGNYTVYITDANGTVGSQIARVSARLAAGSYNGLFYYDGDTTDDTSGFITLALTSTQSYTASIKQHGHTYPFTGKFSANSSTVQVKRTGSGLAPLTVTISAANGGEGKLTGVVRDTTRNIPLVMQRAVYSAAKPTPQAGAYTLSLFGLSTPTAPNGHGYGYVTISKAGAIRFTAHLADDQTISQGVGVAKSGVWPLYAPAYKGRGSVLGWLSFNASNDNSCSGTLRWVKSRSAGGTNYVNGFATKIPVTGSTYKQQADGLGIALDDSALVVDGAKIYSALNDPIVGATQDAIAFAQSGASDGTLQLNRKFGQFSGQIYNPLTHANVTVKGAVLQNQGYATGYFLSSGLSGRVVLQHN